MLDPGPETEHLLNALGNVEWRVRRREGDTSCLSSFGSFVPTATFLFWYCIMKA